MKIGKKIVAAGVENGASLADIADMNALRSSLSHSIYTQMGNSTEIGMVKDDDSLLENQLFK